MTLGGGGVHSSQIAGVKLLRFRRDGTLKIFSQWLSRSVGKIISHKFVCWTAPTTKGQSIYEYKKKKKYYSCLLGGKEGFQNVCRKTYLCKQLALAIHPFLTYKP